MTLQEKRKLNQNPRRMGTSSRTLNLSGARTTHLQLIQLAILLHFSLLCLPRCLLVALHSALLLLAALRLPPAQVLQQTPTCCLNVCLRQYKAAERRSALGESAADEEKFFSSCVSMTALSA